MATNGRGGGESRAFPLAMQVSGAAGMHDLPRLQAQGLAVEIADFIAVAMWQGDYRATARRWAEALRGFPFPKCVHGAFVDLHPGATEPDVVAFARTRHRQSLEVAAEMGCDLMVVHSDFPQRALPPVQARDLAARLADYFGTLATEAAPYGVTLVIENIVDAHPRPLADLAQAIGAANLGLSLDVGHAHLYSPLSLDRWVYETQPYLRHCHLHDNDGLHDRHWKLGDGTMTYRAFFEAVRAQPAPPRVTVEVMQRADAWECVRTLTAHGWYTLPEHLVVATEEIRDYSGID